MMLQLDPPVPLVTTDGERCVGLVLIDYGPEYDLLWVVGKLESRQLWTLPNARLRLGDNISLGRPPREPEKEMPREE